MLKRIANTNSIQKVWAAVMHGDDGVNKGSVFKVNVTDGVLLALEAQAPVARVSRSPEPLLAGKPVGCEIGRSATETSCTALPYSRYPRNPRIL